MDTLREFLIGLKFNIDEPGQRRLVGAIEQATLKAKLFGDVLENMAERLWSAVSSVAEGFDKMYFAAERNKVAVETMRALGYAASQTGSSINDANAAMESLGALTRKYGASAGQYYGGLMGFKMNSSGQFAPDLEAMRRFANRSSQSQEVINEAGPHFSAAMLQSLRHPDAFMKDYGEDLKSQANAGLTKESWKEANEFMVSFRKLWQDIDNTSEGGLTRLLKGLTPILVDFDQFLQAHQKEIAEKLKELADAIVEFVKMLEEKIKNADWKSIDDRFKNFGATVHELTTAFEAFFGLWISAKFIGALAAMSRMLAVLGPLGDLAIMLGLTYGAAKFGANGPINALPPGGTAGAGVNPGLTEDAIDNGKGLGVDPSKYNGVGFGSAWRNSSVGKWWGQTMPTWLGGGSSVGASAPSAPGAGAPALPDGSSPTPGASTPESVTSRLMQDYGLTREQAIGAAGVMGYESGNFTTMQERGQPDGTGGWGWAQWTGPRRRHFMAWAAAEKLDPSSDAANYGFLQHELASSNFAHVIPNLRRTQTVEDAAYAWEHDFEGMREGGPGVPAFGRHIARAQQYDRELPQNIGAAPSNQDGLRLGRDADRSWIPTWKGVDMRSPWGGLQNYWNNAMPVGMSGGDTNHVNTHVTNTFHIDGSGDPHRAAEMVAANQDRVTQDMTRN